MNARLATKAILLCGASTLMGCSFPMHDDNKPTAQELDALHAQFVQVTEVNRPVLPPTPSLLPYREWGVKETAVDSLARIGASSVPALIQTLSDPDPRIRVQAARALARMGDTGKDAVPALIQRLDDPDEAVREAAARALGQMGQAAERAVPALISIIKSPDGKAPPAVIQDAIR